jgi:FkbM family methyltransferase
LLHRRGWTGINIDAHPGAIELFQQLRPDDQNVQAAVSDKVEEIEFLVYEEAALSRIEVREGAAAAGNAALPPPTRKLTLTTTPLVTLLSKHVPAGQKIDLLNIDCEGHDLAVLASNDWERFSAEIVAVEDWETQEITAIDEFLKKRGYALVYLARPAKLFARRAE